MAGNVGITSHLRQVPEESGEDSDPSVLDAFSSPPQAQHNNQDYLADWRMRGSSAKKSATRVRPCTNLSGEGLESRSPNTAADQHKQNVSTKKSRARQAELRHVKRISSTQHNAEQAINTPPRLQALRPGVMTRSMTKAQRTVDSHGARQPASPYTGLEHPQSYRRRMVNEAHHSQSQRRDPQLDDHTLRSRQHGGDSVAMATPPQTGACRVPSISSTVPGLRTLIGRVERLGLSSAVGS